MAPETAEEGQLKMTLFEHLAELRKRLSRVFIAVLLLGGLSLAFARLIYRILMAPVLDALPADISALVYTSAIEEFNVLMTVGLYAGLFLSTPVILWQIWGFVSPGLYAQEKRLAAPFISLGTLAFILGGLFCYFMVLPTMFEFLLNDPDLKMLQAKLSRTSFETEEATRYLRLGNVKQAGALAKKSYEAWIQSEESKLTSEQNVMSWPQSAKPSVVIPKRMDALGRLLEATHEGFGSASRPVLMTVMQKRQEIFEAWQSGDTALALSLCDKTAALLASVSASDTEEFANLWRLERTVADASARLQAMQWTKPMLSMNEQLSLVLVLLLAFGVIFELPLIMAVLGMAGLVSTAFLWKYQRHAFVFCLILAAVVTPTGDAVNLSLMAGPMFLCYELGVLAVWVLEKRRKIELAAS